MRPYLRAVFTAAAIVAVLMIALMVRSLIAFGVFTDVVPGFAGTCVAVGGVTGAEDIVIDEPSGLAFLSAFDRRAKAHGKPSPQDGLYAMALTGPAHPVKLAGTPADFHPHGISLVRTPDGALTLMAINHRSDGTSSVDIFAVTVKDGAAHLTETGSIQGGQLISPNAIAALDQNRFYVTNDHASATAFGRTLDDDLVLPRANIVYFDGNVFRIVASNVVYPNGAVLSRDGHYLYVTESYNRRLTTFARQPLAGTIDVAGTLDIPSNLDNLRFDAAGNLWVGTHPKAFAMAAYKADKSNIAPSEIFKVTLQNGIPQSAALIYADLGGAISGSSVAAVTGHRLLIGSPYDTKILDCMMDH
ncbi:MAG TPA: SMP-30/gluconolactonase/LRE family protein [Rhizomicrobium sp.]|jgi:arylesterase/paraoxonase|nr:SMP-30/gluconolactonase/LRE family protein [Rhizomicrobium sp.]